MPVTAPVAALTNLCSYAISVTATETGFLYPDPNDKSGKYSNTVPDPI